jgi:hypothetical protein
MKKDHKSEDYSQFIHNLNDLLQNENHSHEINRLFKNLALPPGLYVKKIINDQSIQLCNNMNECTEPINDNIHLDLLTLVDSSSKEKRLTKKHKKSGEKKSGEKKDGGNTKEKERKVTKKKKSILIIKQKRKTKKHKINNIK